MPMASLADTQGSLAPDLQKRTRGRFSTAYKLRPVAGADAYQWGAKCHIAQRRPLQQSAAAAAS